MKSASPMDAAWDQYSRIEKRLIRYFDHVPPIEKHDEVWSNQLANILNSTGSCFNSFLTAGLDCNQFDEYPAACVARRKLDDERFVTIECLRLIYEDFYALSQQPVFLLRPERSAAKQPGKDPEFLRLTPFLEWAPTAKKPTGGSPEWWKSFTALKHDGLVKIEKATLKTVIQAVAAFFMVLAVHLCSIPTLARSGIIREISGTQPEVHVVEWDLVTHRPRDENKRVRTEPVAGQYFALYIAETALFGYAYPDRQGVYKGWLEHPSTCIGQAQRDSGTY